MVSSRSLVGSKPFIIIIRRFCTSTVVAFLHTVLACVNFKAFGFITAKQPLFSTDHNKWQDLHYRKPKGGEFKQTRAFTIKYTGGEGGDSTVLFIKQDDNDADVRLDNLMPTCRSQNARRLNREAQAEAISNVERNLE